MSTSQAGKVEQLYRDHAEGAVRLAYLLTGDDQQARDIGHDAFVRLAGRFQGARDPVAFSGSLRAIVVKLSRSNLRRLRTQGDLSRNRWGRAPAPKKRDVGSRDELWRALHALPQRQKTALVLRYYEDLPARQIADAMESSESAIEALLTRGREHLRTEMHVDHELAPLLVAKAEEVAPIPRTHDALRRVRARRTITAGIAGVVVVAALIGGAAVTRVVSGQDGRIFGPREQILSEGRYGFVSLRGDYPMIASGKFRGATWELSGKRVMQRGIDHVRLELAILRDGSTITGQQDVVTSDDDLTMRRLRAGELLDGADAIFGATTTGIETVAVEVADGDRTSVPAHLFTNYVSRSTVNAHYFVAFIPADDPGFVLARDGLGTDLDRKTYGGVSLAPSVIASGKQGRTLWSLQFSGRGGRACLDFSTLEQGGECYGRGEIENGGPLTMSVFKRAGVRGVVAIISATVASVHLKTAGGPAVELPWFEPPRAERRRWPLRIVAVGLEPGTKGTLIARNKAGRVIAKKRF